MMKSTYRLAALPLLAALLAAPAFAAHHGKKPKLAQAAPQASAPMPGVAALLAPAQNVKPSLTLGEALAVAYETNPQLAAQQASLRATDENVAIANGGWRPTISAGGTYAYQQFYFFPQTVTDPTTGAIIFGPVSNISAHPLQGALTVTQPIFRGGRTDRRDRPRQGAGPLRARPASRRRTDRASERRHRLHGCRA